MFLARHLERTSSWIGSSNSEGIWAVRSRKIKDFLLFLRLPRFGKKKKNFQHVNCGSWTVCMYGYWRVGCGGGGVTPRKIQFQPVNQQHTTIISWLQHLNGSTVGLHRRGDTRAII